MNQTLAVRQHVSACRGPTSKLALLVVLAMLGQSAFAQAQVAENDPPSGSQAAVAPAAEVNSDQEERWNAYGQFTTIVQKKDAFHAAYTNLGGSTNSLLPGEEISHTTSATEFLGLRVWKGGEIYLVPEMISEIPLSDLHGLGGSVNNGELEKAGSNAPTFYRSRSFLRQTWGFGGDSVQEESAPMQLAESVDSRRFVLTFGDLAIIDILDKNSYTGDVRQQFMNIDFMTYAAYDFAADARGYSWGLVGEYYYDAWAVRYGRFIVPRDPNQLPLTIAPLKYYGDQLELEHDHEILDKPGKARFLVYKNVERMGRWDDAINAFRADPAENATTCTSFNYGSNNADAPDLCWARRRNSKVGYGLNLEQSITPDVGVFFRGMHADGKTEVYAFTSTDSSVALGVSIKGNGWARSRDSFGIGAAQNWLSAIQVEYLNLGGIDGFIGDGRINYKPERAFESYYNLNMIKNSWLTLDYQHINNPGYNADRGPVAIFGVRLHLEF
jgi:high affinity Mn2+ porin